MNNSKRIKILVSAYACEPNKGSEPGVGWNWVLEMSNFFEVWVITRKNNQDVIENYFQDHSSKFIRFLYYDPPNQITFWKNKLWGIHLFYAIWQIGVNKLIKKTMIKENIDIFHQLTFGNVVLPVSSYGQKKKFIWGPIGGGNTIPIDFSKHYPFKGRMVEWLRRLTVGFLRYSYKHKLKSRNADLILCKDEMTLECIPLKYRHKAIVFTDVAVNIVKKSPVNIIENKITTFISVGALEPWRGFDVLIEAFALAFLENSNIRLYIIGDGYYRGKLQMLINDKGLNNSIFLTGNLSLMEYNNKIENCDVVINSCLKEGAVTVGFDSIAYCKPLICVDTGGYTNYFTNDYSIIIPRLSRKYLIFEMTKALNQLTKVDLRKDISYKLEGLHDKFSWETKGKEIKKLIEERIIKIKT